MNTGEFFDKVESMYKDWQYDHPRLLHSLIRLLKPEVVVEVGTFIGYGACYMARALEENNKGQLYCIDNWQLPNPEWRKEPVKSTLMRSLKELGLDSRVTLIEGDSNNVKWPTANMVYIDGWHSYKACKEDWNRAAMSGATCICFDDSISVVGPRAVVRELERDWKEWDVATLNSAAGFTIAIRRDVARRPVTFSQELDGPGMDIRTQDDIKKHVTDRGLTI